MTRRCFLAGISVLTLRPAKNMHTGGFRVLGSRMNTGSAYLLSSYRLFSNRKSVLFHASKRLPDLFHVGHHGNIVVLEPSDLSGLVDNRDGSAGDAFFG